MSGRDDLSDHDLLIGVNKTLELGVEQLKKLNERVTANQTNIGCLQGCFKAMQVEVKEIKQRPSAVKAVLAVGGLLAIVTAVFGFWKG